ncbi:NAD(P)/FAD-dependent oxidoreductase [Azorhizobium oxalatiphilum]|nr:FAD-dependent oxidoreductase [Azorhizobium oxalatiphilum]
MASSVLPPPAAGAQRIAVIGSGISGLSAAWLLSQRHAVTLFEAEDRLGGHSNTVDTEAGPIDTGFIVYNEATYPNLTALFAHLRVPTKPSDMSLGVSLDGGRLEYSGDSLSSLYAQPRNLLSIRFWSMLRDLFRFYREAPGHAGALEEVSLHDYLSAQDYGAAFRDDHLYPMAAAIWSTPAAEIGAYPAAAFIRFCANHGLLQLRDRPLWRTVDGGSRAYVERLAAAFQGEFHLGRAVRSVRRPTRGNTGGGVEIIDGTGRMERFDHVVLATHADQALNMLSDPTEEERALLGAFRYTVNDAVLHTDVSLMPRRRRVWSSWNYLSRQDGDRRRLSVTYWMNRLQDIPGRTPYLVTLNPLHDPRPDSVIHRARYTHPRFDMAALAAQKRLWSLQGRNDTWYCGAHFGAGFHEDGLQAGLAVAEALGGVRRPWQVREESGRIALAPLPVLPARTAAALDLDLAS